MEHVVIISTCRTPDDKRGHIQVLQCKSNTEAKRVARALASAMLDTSTDTGIKVWLPKGGSAILSDWQVRDIAEFYTSGEDSTGKPAFERVAAE